MQEKSDGFLRKCFAPIQLSKLSAVFLSCHDDTLQEGSTRRALIGRDGWIECAELYLLKPKALNITRQISEFAYRRQHSHHRDVFQVANQDGTGHFR